MTKDTEWPDPPNRVGYMKLRRGLPEQGAADEPMWNYERLMARATPNGFAVVLQILDRTLYAAGSPEYCMLSLDHICSVLRIQARAVYGLINRLVQLKFISRRGKGWWFKANPESFEAAPVAKVRHVERKPQASEVPAARAAVANGSGVHALHSNANGNVAFNGAAENSAEVHVLHSDAKPLFAPQDAIPAPESKPIAPDSAVRAYVCPLGFDCPYPVNDVAASKTLKNLVRIEEGRKAPVLVINESYEPHLRAMLQARGVPVSLFSNGGDDAFDRWREVMKGCGRPVSIERMAACRAEFSKYPVEVQWRIVDDSIIRSETKWDKPQFVTDPLKYLQSRIWDIEPIERRTLPSKPMTKQEKADDVMRRAFEESARRDRERGGPLR